MAAHVATAAVVKVSIGGDTGNRVARFVERGDVLPEGVSDEQLEHLLERGLIEEIDDVDLSDEDDDEAERLAAAQAEADRLAAEKAESDATAEAERLAAEKAEAEQAEADRIAAEQAAASERPATQRRGSASK